MYDLSKTIELTGKPAFIIHNPALEALEQLHKAIIEPFRKAMEAFYERIQQVLKQLVETVQLAFKPMRFVLSLQPVYVAAPTQQTPIYKQQAKNVEVNINTYGFFMLDGKKLNIFHPSSSRCGRFLRALLFKKAIVVRYEEIQKKIGAGDIDSTFKDLKNQLKKLGYKLEYERVPRVGIAYLGISRQH